MKINKKAFFWGVLSGILAPSMVNATTNQVPRNITTCSYDRLSGKVKSDNIQMQEDFYAVGNDIHESMNSNG